MTSMYWSFPSARTLYRAPRDTFPLVPLDQNHTGLAFSRLTPPTQNYSLDLYSGALAFSLVAFLKRFPKPFCQPFLLAFLQIANWT